MTRSRGVAKRLDDGVGFLFKKNKVHGDLGRGGDRRARQGHREGGKTEAPKGALGAGSYQAKHIIIATGARPRVLPGLEPDKKLVWTYFEAMAPDRMPKSLLVIGSGAIGIEFASFYRTLGAEVTVVEVLPQILPVEDAEIAAFARKQLREAGHQDFHRRQGRQNSTKRPTASPPPSTTARAARRRSPSTASFRRSASSATSRTSASKSSA